MPRFLDEKWPRAVRVSELEQCNRYAAAKSEPPPFIQMNGLAIDHPDPTKGQWLLDVPLWAVALPKQFNIVYYDLDSKGNLKVKGNVPEQFQSTVDFQPGWVLDVVDLKMRQADQMVIFPDGTHQQRFIDHHAHRDGPVVRIQSVKVTDRLDRAIRAYMMHIPENLIGERFQVRGQTIEVPGDIQSTQEAANLIFRGVGNLLVLDDYATNGVAIETTQALFATIYERLKYKREFSLIKARESLELALADSADGVEVAFQGTTAATLLYRRVGREFEILEGILQKGERLRDFWLNCKSAVGYAWQELSLAAESVRSDPTNIPLVLIEVENITAWLKEIMRFDPFYGMFRKEEFSRLERLATAKHDSVASWLDQARRALDEFYSGRGPIPAYKVLDEHRAAIQAVRP